MEIDSELEYFTTGPVAINKYKRTYAELVNSDRLKEVRWPFLTNQTSLFQRT